MSWQYCPLKRKALYILRADNGNVKIGSSARPQYRYETIMRMSPIGVVMIGAWDFRDAARTEKSLHRRYKAHHDKHEWYALSDSFLWDLVSLLDERAERAPCDKKWVVR